MTADPRHAEQVARRLLRPGWRMGTRRFLPQRRPILDCVVVRPATPGDKIDLLVVLAGLEMRMFGSSTTRIITMLILQHGDDFVVGRIEARVRLQ